MSVSVSVSLPPVNATAHVLAALVLILCAARIVGTVFARLGQPRVVGEMVSGILIGPTLLGGTPAAYPVTGIAGTATHGTGVSGLLYPPESLAFLDLFGVLALALFTFLIGMQVPQALLRGRIARLTAIAVVVVAASIGMGFALAILLDEPGLWRVMALPDGQPVPFTAHALLIGAGVAATALPVVARILQEKGILATPIGAMGIGAAAVVTPLTFLIVSAASASVNGQDVVSSTAIRLALTAALVVVLLGIARPLLTRTLRSFDADEPLDSGLLAILLAGALLTALAAHLIGIHALTGGLLFGAVVPQVPGLAALVLERMQQFVVVVGIPVFLAVSGLQTDLRIVRLEHLAAVALFLAAIAVSKWGVATLMGRAVGLPSGEAGALGALVACGGLVTLAIALTGRQLGLITPSMYAVFALTAIISTSVTGPLLDRFLAVGSRTPGPSPAGG